MILVTIPSRDITCILISNGLIPAGIGGLTTGGGTGVLTGQYGHIVDNLISARVALANGNVVTASQDVNPDLFWAIRDGGSNFGVCTEFTYRAHKQGPVVVYVISIFFQFNENIFNLDWSLILVDLLSTTQKSLTHVLKHLTHCKRMQ